MIRVLATGKMKDRRLADLVADFGKRIGRLAPFRIEEIRDSDPPREAKALVDLVGSKKGSELVVLLDEHGRKTSSEDMAKLLGGHGSISFLIGGPDGHGDTARERADRVIRLSTMTFTHEMARMILVEQIYRGLSILRNMPYHRR